jgi:UDP-N-acetylglucosamine 2-epimerase (non-hydrolysing)
LVGTDPDKIVAAAQEILAGQGKVGRIPPLWDGKAAERIVEILLQSVPGREATLAAT